MKCPVCVTKGMRSSVHGGLSLTTAMGWSPGHYDEEGDWVEGVNPNTTTTDYRCSHGHRFVEAVRQGQEPTVRITSDVEECPHWRLPSECATCVEAAAAPSPSRPRDSGESQ